MGDISFLINYPDLILTLLLLWGCWRGYRLGVLNLLAGWISYLVGGLLTALYVRPLTEFIDQTGNVTEQIGRWLAPHLPLPETILKQPLNISTTRQLEAFFNNIPLPIPIKLKLLGSLMEINGGTVGQILAKQIVFLILELIILIVIFYGSIYILRRIAYWLTMGIDHTPLGLVGRLLGLFLGFIGQVFFLSIVFGLLRSLLALPTMTTVPGVLPLARQFYGSKIGFFLCDIYDWLFGLLHKIF
ncbi:MAG: hypothetical protein PWP31_575 [Clostridia bacterium]|nr:hypothetical protein [Clostridia bacterium]